VVRGTVQNHLATRRIALELRRVASWEKWKTLVRAPRTPDGAFNKETPSYAIARGA
jgi:hypothetical protein